MTDLRAGGMIAEANEGVIRLRKKLALMIVAAAGAIAMLVPATSSAQVQPACVVVNGPAGLHLQVGYAPNGPDDCTQLP